MATNPLCAHLPVVPNGEPTEPGWFIIEWRNPFSGRWSRDEPMHISIVEAVGVRGVVHLYIGGKDESYLEDERVIIRHAPLPDFDALVTRVEQTEAYLSSARGLCDHITMTLQAARRLFPAGQRVPLVDRIRAVVEERDRLAAYLGAAEITFKNLAAGRISHQRACFRVHEVLNFDIPGIQDDDSPIGGVVVEVEDE
jgi:hypothetical protein